MRSAWLLRLDADAARLAAVGLVRRVAQEDSVSAARGPAWMGHLRAVAFADAWLALDGSPASGPRLSARAVLQALAHRAADFVLQAHFGDAPQALAWLGRESAEACAEDRRGSRPAEPVALVMVWHAVQALTVGGELAGDGDPAMHDGRMAARCEAYIRDGHHRQDVLALLLACARIAATALLQLSGGDQDKAQEHLQHYATSFMVPGGPAPAWVPHGPAGLID